MDKMNICVFSRQTFWQGVKGGMEIHGKLLSEGMVENGNEVSVISTCHPSGKVCEERNGVSIYYLENTVFGSRRNGWKKESVREFFALHQKKPFDVIWSQSFDAYGLTFVDKAALKIPVIPILQGCIQQELVTLSVHAFNAYKRPLKILRSLAGLFFSYFIVQKRLLSFSDSVITVSHQVTKDIKKWYGDRIANKCITIFNGIDTALFHPNDEYRNAIRRQFGIKDQEILLLSAGRLVHEKGHHLNIDVLKQVKRQNQNVKLMIVGEGEARQRLEGKVQENGLENDVIFTGFVENADIVKYYNCADIFLMSTLREEGLPFVLLEVMACAKPVIASRIGGNISVLADNENGIFVSPGDIDELAEKVQSLISNSGFAEKLSLAARESVINEFSDEQMIDKTLEVMYDSLK